MNSKIIAEFEKLVSKNQEDINKAIELKLTDEQRKQSFRLRTNKRVLNMLKNYPEKITKKNFKELIHIDGIGKGTITKIEEILDTGTLSELNDFKNGNGKTIIKKEKVLEELESVINIGRSKALELYNEGIKSVDDLQKKIKNKKIEVNDKILLGLKYYKKFQERIPREHITDIEKFLQDRINYMNRKEKLNFKNKYILTVCGSYRREKETSGDIDILITKVSTDDSTKDNDKHLPKIVNMLKKPWKGNEYEPLLVDNLTDITPTKYMGFAKYKNNLPVRIDIRFVPYSSYYTALLYFTGSGELNKVMRNVAKERGYKLSEYSLLKIKDNKKMLITSERDVFEILEMNYLEPKER